MSNKGDKEEDRLMPGDRRNVKTSHGRDDETHVAITKQEDMTSKKSSPVAAQYIPPDTDIREDLVRG